MFTEIEMLIEEKDSAVWGVNLYDVNFSLEYVNGKKWKQIKIKY